MKSGVLVVLTVAWTVSYSAETGPAFSSLYSITDLGSVQGVPPPYGSLLFQAGSPNVLLLSGDACYDTGQLYTVSLTRDAATNHVTRLGASTPYARTPNIDGGLIYAPNGDLLFTQFPINQIGEITPNSSSPVKTVPAPFGMPAPLGAAKSESTGSLQIVPTGFMAAGNLVMDSVDTSEFCASSLSPDGSGTYNIGACTATVTASGKTEGIIYVPAGTPGFNGEMMLVAEFESGQVVAYSVDSNGLPILASAQIFVSGIAGAQGATIDPITGDFFFSTFDRNGINEVFEVSLIPTGPTPTITSVVDQAAGTTNLTPGMPISITGSGFGSSSTDVARVTIGTETAPVLSFLSATNVIVQVPVDAPLGATTLTVTYKGQPSTAFNIKLVALAPEIEPTASATGSAFYDASGNPITAAHPATPTSQVYCLAIGLGTTSPAQVTNTAATSAATTTQQVQVMVGKETVQPTYAGLDAGGTPGYYQVLFTVPADAEAGNLPVTLSEGGLTSNTQMLAVAPPLPVINAIVNGATFASGTNPQAANSFVSLFGTNFGNANTNGNIFPATSFQGLSVLVNGTAIPLYVVAGTGGQINVVLPSELGTSGTANVEVMTAAGTSQAFELALTADSVGIFRITDPSDASRHNGAVLFTNTAWKVMPLSMAKALGLPSCSTVTGASICGMPAKAGDQIEIYLTGLGKATPNGDPNGTVLATGSLAPANGSVLYKTVETPKVTIGSVAATVSFSGIAPGNAGQYQINVQVPDGVAPGDNVQLTVTMPDGSTDTVTIAIGAS